MTATAKAVFLFSYFSSKEPGRGWSQKDPGSTPDDKKVMQNVSQSRFPQTARACRSHTKISRFNIIKFKTSKKDRQSLKISWITTMGFAPQTRQNRCALILVKNHRPATAAQRHCKGEPELAEQPSPASHDTFSPT